MIKKIFKIIRDKFKESTKPEKDLHHLKDSPETAKAGPQQEEAGAAAAESATDGAPQRKKRKPGRERGRRLPGRDAQSEEQLRVPSWDISEFQVEPAAGKARFHDFGLPPEIMHAIADLGFEYCTPIQAETLEKTLAGKDAIGQAQTGTGKTAAYLITILTRLLAAKPAAERKNGAPRCLILAPTRELAIQISRDGIDLAKYCNLSIVAVYGGMDYQKQLQQLEVRPVDLIVATPGRLMDFQQQGAVNLSKVEILVIDEADRMLDMGFIPDVKRIVNSTPTKDNRQTMLFSATVTEDVKQLTAQWTKNPVSVAIEPDQVAVDTIDQIVYLATAEQKYTLLYNIITTQNLERVIVFANRRDETSRLADRLQRNGISCDLLSGDVAQNKRMRTLDDFRNGKIKVMVATDVAGRGIHIDGVSHVINFTLPYEPEDYVHRIGRTGRAGASGISISFACEEGSFYLPEIEKFIGRKLTCIVPEEELLKPPPARTARKQEQSSGRPGSAPGGRSSGNRSVGSRSGSGRPGGRSGGSSRPGSSRPRRDAKR